MKRLLKLIIIILIIFVTKNVYAEECLLENYAKEYDFSIYSYYNDSSNLSFEINNQYKPLTDVKYKLYDLNKNLVGESENVEGQNYIKMKITNPNSYDNLYSRLTTEQKELINSIRTTNDLSNIRNETTIICSNKFSDLGISSPCSTDMTTEYFYCSITLPSIYYLNTDEIKEGFIKENYVIPLEIRAIFLVNNYQSNNYNYYTNNTGIIANKNVELKGLIYQKPGTKYYLNYDSNKDYSYLANTNSRETKNNWKNNAINGVIPILDVAECDYDHYFRTYSSWIEQCSPSYDTEILHKQGNYAFEIETTVNDKDNITVIPNSKLDYKIRVKNIGTVTSNNNIITSEIPSELQYVEGSATNNGVYDNNKITWNIEKIEPDEEIELRYQVITPMTITNTNFNINSSITNDNIENPIQSKNTTVNIVNKNQQSASIGNNPETGNIIALLIFSLFFTFSIISVMYKAIKTSS